MEMEWNGFYVPALDQLLDLNEDGISDVSFYTTEPTNKVAGVTYINVSATSNNLTNPQQLKAGTSGEITWLKTIPRVWDDKYYLYPIPQNAHLLNPKLGQNSGW